MRRTPQKRRPAITNNQPPNRPHSDKPSSLTPTPGEEDCKKTIGEDIKLSSSKKKKLKNTTPSACVRQSARLLNAVRVAQNQDVKPVLIELDAFNTEKGQPQDPEKQALIETQDLVEHQCLVEQKAQKPEAPQASIAAKAPLILEAPQTLAKPESPVHSNFSERSLEEKVEYLFQLVLAHEKKIETLSSEATLSSFLTANPAVADITYKRLYAETEKKNEDLRAENSRLAVMCEKAFGLLNAALGRVDTFEKMNGTFSDALEKLKDAIPPTPTRATCNAPDKSVQARGSVIVGLTAPDVDTKTRDAKKPKVAKDV